ncbi:hypothetical protein Sa4125_08070 [Aureimonas sp. SA4125]|uniref:NAD-dependent dehydratase n=1 Tax=Aureimonas sp. SA4125 TaxID=2826993 RepID=UPI001CC6A8F9|nr:NAD-dependent dehydratase [Aureimonas sp. SA4125]BDA83265.1 hypothetical protein Sa4125_08070 [Aureimonas sp. SA4125]
MKLLLVGSTGLVGGFVLAEALADIRFNSVVALTRTPLPPHAKLLNPVVDFDALPADAPWWDVDAAICTLGTTRRRAGSDAAFTRVDHDYPLAVARLARRHGAGTFVLNSALGADPRSRLLYSRTKGELERDLASLGFGSLTLVRPGLIGGDREERRMAESLASTVLGVLSPLLPARYRINPAPTIAAALLDAAAAALPGRQVVPSEALI